jgi:hypothetical protein
VSDPESITKEAKAKRTNHTAHERASFHDCGSVRRECRTYAAITGSQVGRHPLGRRDSAHGSQRGGSYANSGHGFKKKNPSGFARGWQDSSDPSNASPFKHTKANPRQSRLPSSIKPINHHENSQ